MKTLRNYIGGEWVAPAAAEYLDLTNPATGEQLGKVPLSGAREVDQAVAAAQAAFVKWRQVPPVVRARYLFKLKYLMEDAATAEISRSQVWQWARHGARLTDGRVVTTQLVREIMAKQFPAKGLASDLFERLMTGTEFPEFLTLLAYEHLP